MKKLLIIILAVIAVLPVSATINQDLSDAAFSRVIGTVERPISVKMAGMGMAGISLAKGFDALNYNPAGLADSGFTLTVPYVTATMYNAASMISDGFIRDTISFAQGTMNSDDYLTAAQDFSSKLGTYNKLANVEAGLGFTVGGFGFNFYIVDNIHTYNGGAGNLASISLVNKLNAAISIGYGHRISFQHGYSLDLGLSVRFSYLAISDQIGATSFVGEGGFNFNELMNSTPMYYGWAVPIDVAIRGNFPYGFSLTAALRNINGFYYMNQSEGISSWVGQMFQFGTESVYTPMSLDVGLAWEYDELWWIHPTIALDFVDLIGFKDDTSFTFRSFMKHVNFGLELGFLEDHLVIRGGLSQGYLSAGLTVDLWAFKIDAAYYWREFGSVVGTKGVDALTVRLSFGWGPNF